jgi:hypothetical protein
MVNKKGRYQVNESALFCQRLLCYTAAIMRLICYYNLLLYKASTSDALKAFPYILN